MPASTLRVLAAGARVRELAVVSLATLVVVWILDAAVDAALVNETLAKELFHPGLAEVWMRLVITALLLSLYIRTLDRARLRLLSAALAEAPDGIQIVDVGGCICYSNAAVQAMYGYTPEELRGREVDVMNADPALARDVIIPALRRDGRWAGEVQVRHKDGHVFPVWLATSLVPGGIGRPPASVGIIRDVSERKRKEEELRCYATQLEEANSLKELFADILRHDLLTPLMTVRLAVDMLAEVPHDARAQRLVASARRGCSQLTEMIDSAARYAKVSAAKDIEVERIDLGKVLAEVVAQAEALAEARQARIAYAGNGSYPARAHPMIADVFANLLSNAVKYGPPEGTVALEVNDAGDRWRVSVADRGEGIPDAYKQRVFDRFERIEKEGVKGTGLGLAIAKRIVTLHGGEIAVKDNPGGGAVFEVLLPKNEARGAGLTRSARGRGTSPPSASRLR